MNKIYVFFCLLLLSGTVSAQQFSQYSTGTLFESFENPSVRSFIPDSSREYAFNFFIPNFNANAYITGDIQGSVKSRLFSATPSYVSNALQTGKNRHNHINANVNAYAFMFKAFTSLNGDVEMGLSYQTRAESRGLITDETVALLAGSPGKYFPDGGYQNIFNNHFQMQLYNQIGFSYREKINKQLAFGFKLSALLGIKYAKFDVYNSSATFNNPDDYAIIAMQGKYYSSYIPGRFTAHDFLPTFRNPGAAINFGASFITDDKITLQANVKDLGFIHWSKRSIVDDFNGSDAFKSLSGAHREDTVYNHMINIMKGAGQPQSFSTKTNARFELSASKIYWIDPDNNFKYIPTLVGSKELWYTGFTAGLVNHIKYGNYMGSLTFTYDDLKLFNAGIQFMYQNPNVEFFIGSERLINTGRTAFAAFGNQTQIDHVGTYTGMDLFMGFSFKFGAVIEHPMNASYIPNGEKGFFGRLWGRLFKTNY
ncbi:MAG TPA: DUF5723 family protein [Mucilaginibacter sp.]